MLTDQSREQDATTKQPYESTESAQPIMKEILELARGTIQKARLEKSKDLRWEPDEHGLYILLQREGFSGHIRDNCSPIYEEHKQWMRYSLRLLIDGYCDDGFTIRYRGNGDGAFIYSNRIEDEYYAALTPELLIMIHKGMVEVAKENGVEYVSNINYADLVMT